MRQAEARADYRTDLGVGVSMYQSMEKYQP